MKLFGLLILMGGISNPLLADEGPVGLTAQYIVVSDVKDASIKPGHFVVQGVVKMESGAFPMSHVQVGMLQSNTSVKTDSLGHFSLQCKTGTDSALYFYKEGWSELVIENYRFKDQHRITLSVYLSQEHVNAVKRKPVIYCYAEQALTASVQLDPRGRFTFTYPAYDHGWQVMVNPSGGITDLKTGKSYPYLFWEASSDKLSYQVTEEGIPGFVINTDSTVQFLQSKLTQLGLNQTEQTDFITFWGPILQKQPYALVQFLVDEVYESDIASLQISPRPDALRRVYILCSPMSDRQLGIPVIAQELNSFERLGFTVVEWGGSELDLTYLKPY